MLIYYLLLLLVLLFSLKPKSNISLFIIFCCLLFVASQRGISVGTDTENYYDLYKDPDYVLQSVKGIEYGWLLLDYIAYYIFGSYKILLFFSSFLSLFFVFLAVKRGVPNKPLYAIAFYILLYFYCSSLNIMRQSIALSIILLAYTYLNDKRWKYYMIVFGAILFHSSAIIALLIPFFTRINISVFSYLVVLITSFAIGAMNMIGLLLGILGGTGLYSVYTDVILGENSFSITRLMLNLLFIFLIVMTNMKNYYIKIFFLGLVLLNIFSSVPIIARISQYLLITQVLLYPQIEFIYMKHNALLFKSILLIYALIVFVFSLNMNIGEVVPYTFAEY